MTRLSRAEARLYGLMLRELHGDFGPELRAAVGERSLEIYDAIWRRVRERAASDPHAAGLAVDAIDWAAIRILAAAIEAQVSPASFESWTGRDLRDVLELANKAKGEIRSFRRRPGLLLFQRGDCLIRIPLQTVAGQGTLAGIPGQDSWDALMPDCARGLRDEIVAEIKGHHVHRGHWKWIEREETSWEALADWVRSAEARESLGTNGT